MPNKDTSRAAPSGRKAKGADSSAPGSRARRSGPPTRRPENALARRLGGGVAIAGVDEAGRGPLAGPVVAAAVIWPDNRRPPKGLNDSKQVRAEERARIFQEITAKAEAVGVGLATAREIDSINILQATRLAARRALDALPTAPAGVVSDYLTLPGCPLPVVPLVGGDCLSVNIAAASIVAKVIRDRMMDHYAAEYPGFGWESNRGYGTAEHMEALARFGPTTLHRLTFAGVGFFCEFLRPSKTFLAFRAALEGEEAPQDYPSSVIETRPAPSPLLATCPRMARAGCLCPRDSKGGPPLDPCIEVLLSNEWEGRIPEALRLSYLDEQEAEAVDLITRNPIHSPHWLAK